jgi:hypothetical protein
MARATLKDVESAIERYNDTIEPCGSKIELGQRYNYKCIDVYDKSGRGGYDTLECGLSTSGALQYVRAMINGLSLVRNPRRSKCKLIKRRKGDTSWGVK